MKRARIIKKRKANRKLKGDSRPLLDRYGNSSRMRRRLIKSGRCVKHARKSCAKDSCKR